MKTLELKHIKKSFSGLEILQDVSLELAAGTITTILGENGSGKTTLFHLITGMLEPDTGDIYFKERSINGMNPGDRSNLGIGRVWQTPRICKNLSVLDNLLLAAPEHPGRKLRNYFKWRAMQLADQEIRLKAHTIAEQMNLPGNLEKTAGALSLGMQKLLSVGMLQMGQADLLLLDEPFAGVSLPMIDQISQVLRQLRAAGKTICLIEHHRDQALALSDQCLLLSKGLLIEYQVIKEADDVKN